MIYSPRLKLFSESKKKQKHHWQSVWVHLFWYWFSPEAKLFWHWRVKCANSWSRKMFCCCKKEKNTLMQVQNNTKIKIKCKTFSKILKCCHDFALKTEPEKGFGWISFLVFRECFRQVWAGIKKLGLVWFNDGWAGIWQKFGHEGRAGEVWIGVSMRKGKVGWRKSYFFPLKTRKKSNDFIHSKWAHLEFPIKKGNALGVWLNKLHYQTKFLFFLFLKVW